MAGGTGVYVTWVTGSIVLSVALMYVFKPPWARITLSGFQDMFRRYWAHIILTFSIYLWKDIFDQIDRTLMANTRLDMTPFIYAIEGDLVLWVQQTFLSDWLTFTMTHFYVAGYMTIIFSSFVYCIYFDDRHMADRVSLTMFYVYALAVPFYLFFNVRVTGDHIPEMDTLAYHLTPEIQTWFTRIDPFTNGMPSLHIGLPTAVWLTYSRFDDDGRWKKFRVFLLLYIVLTAFAIIYLGIHWIVDIIGGIIIAFVAVRLSSRTQGWVWRWFDERVFVLRFAWLLADWRRPISEAKDIFRSGVLWMRMSGSRQTFAVMVVSTLMTGTVLLYDATHQDFPAQGVTWPDQASGAEGWLFAIEENEQGEWSIVAWEMATQEMTLVDSNITFDDQWGEFEVEMLVSGSMVAIRHGYEFEFYDMESDRPSLMEKSWITGPLYLTAAITHTDSGEFVFVGKEVESGLNSSESLHVLPWSGTDPIELQNGPDGAVELAGASSGVVWWVEKDEGTVVHLEDLGLVRTSQFLEVNASISELQDIEVERLTGIMVDYENATVNAVSIAEDMMVVQINLSAVDRMVLIDLNTGEQRILGDAMFPVAAPSIGHGYVAWQHQQFLDSLNPTAGSVDWDVRYHVIAENQSYQLHRADSVNQTSPQVLKDHIAWLQETGDGGSELRIFTIEEVFEPYSSKVLQAWVIWMPLLLLFWAGQRSREAVSKKDADEEE